MMSAQRLKQTREQLDAWQIDALLITNSYNRMYLTDFTGSAGYVLITGDKAVLLVDFRYIQQAADETRHYEVVRHDTQAADTICRMLKSFGVKRLGFEQNDISFGAYAAMREKFSGMEMVPTRDIVERLRAFKDSGELRQIRTAVEIAEQAFEHILQIMKPGMTERDVSAELGYAMRKHGAVSSAYAAIVASGERSALPHGLAGDKPLAANEWVTLDFGANAGGYLCDVTRTVCLGAVTKAHRDMYAVVLEANRTALAGIKPGMTGKEADALARDVIAGMGYGEHFGHGLGHAFGLEIHEPARLSPTSEDVLRPGMVMTVEPGIYIPGFGGVRIEDDFVVTETGIEVLTKANKELIML